MLQAFYYYGKFGQPEDQFENHCCQNSSRTTINREGSSSQSSNRLCYLIIQERESISFDLPAVHCVGRQHWLCLLVRCQRSRVTLLLPWRRQVPPVCTSVIVTNNLSESSPGKYCIIYLNGLHIYSCQVNPIRLLHTGIHETLVLVHHSEALTIRNIISLVLAAFVHVLQ